MKTLLITILLVGSQLSFANTMSDREKLDVGIDLFEQSRILETQQRVLVDLKRADFSLDALRNFYSYPGDQDRDIIEFSTKDEEENYFVTTCMLETSKTLYKNITTGMESYSFSALIKDCSTENLKTKEIIDYENLRVQDVWAKEIQ